MLVAQNSLGPVCPVPLTCYLILPRGDGVYRLTTGYCGTGFAIKFGCSATLGQRDRTDATAAAASAAAATANAKAATAAGDCEDAQDTLGYQVRFTDAHQTKIDELAALAKANGVDAAAVDAIKNRANL